MSYGLHEIKEIEEFLKAKCGGITIWQLFDTLQQAGYNVAKESDPTGIRILKKEDDFDQWNSLVKWDDVIGFMTMDLEKVAKLLGYRPKL